MRTQPYETLKPSSRTHYEYMVRTGRQPGALRTPTGLFVSRVLPTDTCWLWTGDSTQDGYGMMGVRGRSVLAHRFSYESFVGPIPDGLQIDHLCRVRSCVNPAHMEPVTAIVNQMRGEGVPARNARKTHCHRGHPFDEKNTYLWPNRGRLARSCRACSVIRTATYRTRKDAVR